MWFLNIRISIAENADNLHILRRVGPPHPELFQSRQEKRKKEKRKKRKKNNVNLVSYVHLTMGEKENKCQKQIGKSPFIDPLLRKGMVGKNAFAHDFVCMMYYTYKEPPYLLVQAPLAY